MSLSFLQKIGLSVQESLIYEILVKEGELPFSQVIVKVGLKRPTVYKLLYSLQEKGLVDVRDVKKKLHARPQPPEKLLKIADASYKDIELTRQSLLSFLPGLNSLYINSTEKPVVKTYEGIEGLKEIYEDLLNEGKPIYALVQAATVEPELYEWLTTTFVRKRIKAKLHVKALVASSKASKVYVDKSKQEYRTAKLIDGEKFPFQHEVEIYGDKVAIIHYKRDEPLIGIVIHHPQIALTMRAWFDLAWGNVH